MSHRPGAKRVFPGGQREEVGVALGPPEGQLLDGLWRVREIVHPSKNTCMELERFWLVEEAIVTICHYSLPKRTLLHVPRMFLGALQKQTLKDLKRPKTLWPVVDIL